MGQDVDINIRIVRGRPPDVDSGSLNLYLDSDLDRDSGSVASTIESAMSPSFFFTRAAFGPEFSIFLP